MWCPSIKTWKFQLVIQGLDLSATGELLLHTGMPPSYGTRRRARLPDPLNTEDPAVQHSIDDVWRQESRLGSIYIINPRGGATLATVRSPQTLVSSPSMSKVINEHAGKHVLFFHPITSHVLAAASHLPLWKLRKV